MPQFDHNYNYVSRGAMYGWMNTYLGLGLDDPIVADDYVPLTREETSVWDAAHPKPASGEAEERRVTSWWTRWPSGRWRTCGRATGPASIAIARSSAAPWPPC